MNSRRTPWRAKTADSHLKKKKQSKTSHRTNRLPRKVQGPSVPTLSKRIKQSKRNLSPRMKRASLLMVRCRWKQSYLTKTHGGESIPLGNTMLQGSHYHKHDSWIAYNVLFKNEYEAIFIEHYVNFDKCYFLEEKKMLQTKYFRGPPAVPPRTP